MEKYGILVSAGSVQPDTPIPAAFAGADVIACDAGWHNCEVLGLTPKLVLGDFDSSERPADGDVQVLPTEKDDTDTHYAARLAREQGYTHLLLLGALGGKRLEHTLANLSTGLWLAQQGADVTLADVNTRVSFVLPGQPRSYPKTDKLYFSLFPMEGTADGVTLTGAKYPLTGASLTANYPLTVSNEWAGDAIRVETARGALVVLETSADR